jgi:hypothetical protein
MSLTRLYAHDDTKVVEEEEEDETQDNEGTKGSTDSNS